MSEEILKALMQLFAIVAKQDGGNSVTQSSFVRNFLASQISADRIEEYFNNFVEFVENVSEKEKAGKTSVKDSVRTIAICKKINKTLNQKQKIIVVVRLFEFIKSEYTENNSNATQILITVTEVFNISSDELARIRLLVTTDINKAFLGDDFITISDDVVEDNQIRLNCIHHHGFSGKVAFLFLRNNNLIFFKYIGESELFVNGLFVNAEYIYVFSPGSSLRHNKGSVFYSDIISRFLNQHLENKLTFEVAIQEHRHKNGKIALQQLNLNYTNGQLVGIMGASGSGKTTLLNVLSGNDKLTNGSVLVNGFDLHKEKKQIRGIIGYIPQDDLLIEELTVFQNLFFSAQLSFKDIKADELAFKVNRLLVQLGLDEVKNVKVGNPLKKLISGGQRKRLNIALELIREPEILFVDEPTSGLSSKDSENVMDLLKEISLKGKLIFVVIHQPSSEVYKLFDNILIIDVGGYPIYYGNPIEAVVYFKNHTSQINSEVGECSLCGSVNPELIFNLVESKEIDEFGNYTNNRKYSSIFWNQMFQKNLTDSTLKNIQKRLKKLTVPTKLFQLLIFLKRDGLTKFTNLQYIILNLVEVPILALILSLFIRNSDKDEINEYSYFENGNIPAFYFMAIVVALLVGLTLSAEEIFKDLKILKREKFLNLSKLSYLSSKIIILFSISLLQTVLFCAVGFSVLKIPDNYLQTGLILYSVFCSANLMGLILSSTFNSPVTIYIIIPLVIIPQMLLGGAMFKFSNLSEFFGGSKYKVPTMSNIMVSRWAYEAIITNAFHNNKFQKEFFYINKLESKLNYRTAYLLPKLDEIQEQLSSDKISLENRTKKEKLINWTIKNEIKIIKDEYDVNILDNDETANILGEIKRFYSDKLNDLERAKEKAIRRFIIAHGLTIKDFKTFEHNFTNECVSEIALNQTEKVKILYDTIGNKLVQIIDPIYKNPEGVNKLASFDCHFLSDYKYVFKSKVNTFSFNLICIWTINAFLFLILYFNLFKILFSIKISNKKIKYA